MAVFFIVGSIDLEGRELCTALCRHALGCRLLLRGNELELELAKLQVGAQAKERGRALDQRRVAGERHVTGLNELYDLVFLAVILELEVLRVEVEGGVGVVVKVHVDLVANLSVDVEVYLLVKVDIGCLAVSDGQRRVVDVLHRGAKLQFCRSLGLYAHAAGAENLFGGTEVEVHVGKVEFLLALGLVNLVVL